MTQIELKCNTTIQQTQIIHSANSGKHRFQPEENLCGICKSKIHQGVLIYFLCIDKLPIIDIKGLEAGYTIWLSRES